MLEGHKHLSLAISCRKKNYFIINHKFKIYGIVTDGMKGLAKAFSPYPVQLCQFHQMLIVRRYITQDPEIEALVMDIHY